MRGDARAYPPGWSASCLDTTARCSGRSRHLYWASTISVPSEHHCAILGADVGASDVGDRAGAAAIYRADVHE